MSRHISTGPWANPNLEAGFYEATIENVKHLGYGTEGSEMLEIRLRILRHDDQLVTRLYLPQEFSSRCQHRLWYFCQSIGLEAYDLIEDPSVADERKLVIEISTTYPKSANYGRPYSDVTRFLPLAVCERDIENSAKKITM